MKRKLGILAFLTLGISLLNGSTVEAMQKHSGRHSASKMTMRMEFNLRKINKPIQKSQKKDLPLRLKPIEIDDKNAELRQKLANITIRGVTVTVDTPSPVNLKMSQIERFELNPIYYSKKTSYSRQDMEENFLDHYDDVYTDTAYLKAENVNLEEGIISVEEGSFASCYNLLSIVIPKSITSLGDYCFYNCEKLASITIPSGLKYIGNWTFAYCHVYSIAIPYGVTSIGNYCFQGCYFLSEVGIPETVKSIGNDCFAECFSLKQIAIPVEITHIGDRCFCNCHDLTHMYICEDFITPEEKRRLCIDDEFEISEESR